MYCEKCGEENLQYYIESDLRPFDIYCSESCIESLIEEIFNGEWDSHFSDNNEYKNELRKQFINNDNWFLEHCTNRKVKLWLYKNVLIAIAVKSRIFYMMGRESLAVMFVVTVKKIKKVPITLPFLSKILRIIGKG